MFCATCSTLTPPRQITDSGRNCTLMRSCRGSRLHHHTTLNPKTTCETQLHHTAVRTLSTRTDVPVQLQTMQSRGQPVAPVVKPGGWGCWSGMLSLLLGQLWGVLHASNHSSARGALQHKHKSQHTLTTMRRAMCETAWCACAQTGCDRLGWCACCSRSMYA